MTASPSFFSLRRGARLLGLAPLLVLTAWAAEHAHVTILATTDTHAHIDPIDYYTNRPDQTGLAKAATIIAKVRHEKPDLLLLDSGDTIQGTPLAYYHNRKNNQPPDPTILAMNALHYDAMAVGNHEYNFGLKVLEKARAEADFPWLSANTYRTGTDQTAYQPYLLKEVEGVRVAVLGLTTPGVPYWDNAENYAGLEFREPVAEARKWVSLLRTREKADVVVIALHMGLEEDLRTGLPTPNMIPSENTALAIARQVPGIDVIFMGHTHREVPALFVNGVLLTQAGRWADHVARVDLFLDKDGGSGWKVGAKGAYTIPVTDKIAPDPAIMKIAEPYDRETQAWLGRVIGESARELAATDARVRDTALIDLIQHVQLEAGPADVSMASGLNLGARIPQGPVTVRDMSALYPYENTLVVIEGTGAMVKAALEHSASFFLPYAAGRTPAELIDQRIPAYNFDSAEGVTYEMDLSRPVGDRIVNLRYQGRPLDPAQKLRVAINNYRFNGGGGYGMYKGAPVLARSAAEIRDLIIDWTERHHDIPAEPTGNWRIVTP